jgi:uncharacterized SAM-binding protein YcdF (DUF218 family)
MFFALSKIIDFILLPISWIFILMLVALISKNKSFQKKVLWANLILILLLSNEVFVNYFQSAYESQEIHLKPTEKYTWGVILGGGMIRGGRQDEEGIHVGETADRMIQPILLYKQGHIKKILITGGNTSIGKMRIDHTEESKKTKILMVAMGVKESDIFLETQARNTHENATYTAQKLANFSPKDSILLITSAMHMPRSSACYEKVGFRVKAFPVDFKKKDTDQGILTYVFPTARNFNTISDLIREMAGFVIYKLVGYC